MKSRRPSGRASSLLASMLAVISTMTPALAFALSMAFINPGRTGEPFWDIATQSMDAAAKSLGIEFEVLTAERDFLAQIRLTRELTSRPPEQRPDYLIVAAEKGTLAAQLELAHAAGIPVFLAFNTVRPTERALVGYPRERFPSWIGSLAPEAEEGGYQSARELIVFILATLPEGESVDMIAIAGDRSTDTSLKRNEGMLRAVAEFPQVRLRQQVHADWSGEKAAEQAAELFRRYPDVRLVWSASEILAFGAMQALRNRGGEPGRDVFFGALNATPGALEAVSSGELAALAGGHHLTGAWAMVMLHDHYHGRDFAEAGTGLEQSYPMFSLLDADTARRLLSQPTNHPVDFCSFSRVCNPDRLRYDFSFSSWLQANP